MNCYFYLVFCGFCLSCWCPMIQPTKGIQESSGSIYVITLSCCKSKPWPEPAIAETFIICWNVHNSYSPHSKIPSTVCCPNTCSRRLTDLTATLRVFASTLWCVPTTNHTLSSASYEQLTTPAPTVSQFYSRSSPNLLLHSPSDTIYCYIYGNCFFFPRSTLLKCSCLYGLLHYGWTTVKSNCCL